MPKYNSNKVLLLDTSFAAAPIYEYLLSENFDVWVMGSRPHDDLALRAKSNWIEQDYSKVNEVRNHINQLGFNFVVPGCTDVSIETCVQLGVNPQLFDDTKTNSILCNKESFRELCDTLNIPSPRVIEYRNLPLSGKYISKPVDSYSGTGVTVFDGLDVEAGKIANNLAIDASRSSTSIIETYISGQLYSFSAFLQDRSVVSYCVVKEGGSANPFAVDTSYVDSIFDAEISGKIRHHIEKIADYLKLKNGLFHLQFILDGDVPYFIEIARRCPGDLYPLLIEFSTGLKYASKYASYYVNRICNSEPTGTRYILRHTLTSDDLAYFKGVRFCIPVNVYSYFPLLMLGQTIEPRQKTRVGIVFCENESITEVEQEFNLFINRNFYQVG